MIIRMIIPVQIHANEYDGHEDEWLAKCSGVQATEADAQACSGFKDYYTNKMNELHQQVAEMEDTASQLKADMSNIEEVVQTLNRNIEDLSRQIEAAEQSIQVSLETIQLLDAQMIEKQRQIDALDAQIKLRMTSEQATIGTNRIIDIVMGASSVVDLLRVITGLSQITANDQGQIKEADQARKELKHQQDEQKRLQENIELQIVNNEKLKATAEEGKAYQQIVYAQYQKEEANIMERMMAANTNASAIAGSIDGINTNYNDDIFTPGGDTGGDSGEDAGGSEEEKPGVDGGNAAWLRPVGYARNPYAGTWHYSGGGTHLGADYSGPIGANVVAPANAIILFARNGYSTNGYFGSSEGWPYGAANSIHLLTQVDGTIYGVSLFHLANEGFLVQPGQFVSQGEVIAHTGNSGNSTGPHTHIEVVNLGTMSVTQAQAKFAASKDFAWGLGWGDAALNATCSAKGWATPCRERPEDIFGY